VLFALVCTRAAFAQGVVPGLAVPSAAPHRGVFVSAPIAIDGAITLRVAALASPPPDAMPLSTRVFLIDSAIAQVLAMQPDSDATVYDPDTFKVGVKQEDDEYALVVTDKKHPTPFPILTVTATDARYANLTTGELALQWQQALHSALYQALERRQPAEITRGTNRLWHLAIVLALLTIAGILLFRFLRNRLAAAIVVFVIVLLWFAAVVYGLMLFPQTVTYGAALLRTAIRVASIWVGGFLLERLCTLGIHQWVRFWALIGVPAGQKARYLLRVPTMSRALIGFVRFVIVFVAILATLGALEIPIASVVTIGGIAALAVGFAAQSLVRDCLNGILVLFEDQYVVGDYIMIGDYNGVVEHLTLRVVQIRDSRGNLITIPHSSVNQVVNSSRNWSRVDYRVAIDVGVEPSKAMEVLHATIEALSTDPSWKGSIVEIEAIGVEGMSRNGIVLRASVRTAPLRQFDVRREINLRAYDAFAKAQIPLGNDPSAPFVTAPTASPDPS
jgi:moderate conductance mechanosensitive channel